MSKLSKIGDEEQEGQYGYVHAVSGPGMLAVSFLWFIVLTFCKHFSRYG